MMMIPVPRAPGPGRPKDLEKRAAILCAAKRLFPENGFEGTSMDAIAAAANVSKLTVYSHFKDKETLFSEAVRASCLQLMPPELFEIDLEGSPREQLAAIARAFFALITREESIALNRLLSGGTVASAKLGQMFWEAGPQVVQSAFADFLRRLVAAGQLDIADVPRATSQFFSLLKGELHARLLCGCCKGTFTAQEIDQHLAATVDMFLRAYAVRPQRA
ncbi:MAG: TetR/AcrR family transcriptional regulator [Xanthomonadales bacterium]|nr:TetR/AcrR family transcriptional regulator [Xanthomonadales bacterium]